MYIYWKYYSVNKIVGTFILWVYNVREKLVLTDGTKIKHIILILSTGKDNAFANLYHGVCYAHLLYNDWVFTLNQFWLRNEWLGIIGKLCKKQLDTMWNRCSLSLSQE